mmetsp:Transcript_23168/g.75373  ORF Transcript_23168/g.75373 Transcript_23168/m.75373 type:complete len:295 (-) Transcript_23168:747-1631(-)
MGAPPYHAELDLPQHVLVLHPARRVPLRLVDEKDGDVHPGQVVQVQHVAHHVPHRMVAQEVAGQEADPQHSPDARVPRRVRPLRGGAIDEHPVDQLQRLDLAHDEDGLEGHREPPHVQRRLGPSSAHPPLLALEVELGGMVEEGSHVGRHHDPFQVPHILLSVPPLASHRSHCHHAQVPTVGVSPARPAGVQVTVTRAAMLGVVGCTLEAGQVLPDQLHVKSLGRIRLSHVLSPFQVRFGLLVPAMRRQELPQVHRRLVHPRHEVYLEVGDMAWYLLLCGLNAFGSRQVIQSQL